MDTPESTQSRSQLESATRSWRDEGFAVLPAYLSPSDLGPALAELSAVFPSAVDFHDDAEAERNAAYRDEFGGITDFPFASTALSVLSVHEKLIDLAEVLLGSVDLRVIGIEAWAKFTGAAVYEQEHHRDYLSHSLVAPSTDPRFEVLEMFVYLVDTPATLGPPSLVPRQYSNALPAIPNWYPGVDREDTAVDAWVSASGEPELYRHEVDAAGPAGTVVAWTNTTFHRGRELTLPRGARYTLMANFRPSGNDWNSRHNWQQHANGERWHAFVTRASPRHLALFGWPPPGHPYWTPQTIDGTQRRYAGLDITPWKRGAT
jgi:hypothetical protein